jgi:glyoxylase I family protein
MQKVTGIGGAFFRAKDPMGLSKWYEDNLGINGMDPNGTLWVQQSGPTVFAPFSADTDYFGSDTQNFMFNFRVENLEAMLAQLRANNVTIVKDIETQEGMGSFASIEDPEGNRIELWQPSL